MAQKNSRTIDQQIQLLENRRLIIKDKAYAKECLSRISYFRLKFYWWDMQSDSTNHVFADGCRFEDIIRRYDFDKELRSVLLLGIETIEIGLRAKIIYHMSQDYGALWYLNASLFNNATQHQLQLQRLETEFMKSGETFAKEFIKKHPNISTDHPEAWLMMEVATFGELSKIYKNIAHQLPAKSRIANDFGFSIHSDLSSWLEAITYLRNIVAHHSRLWGRNMVKKPAYPFNPHFIWLKQPLSKDSEKRPFHIISAMLYLCSAVNKHDILLVSLFRLFRKYYNLPLSILGFPKDWKKEPLWQMRCCCFWKSIVAIFKEYSK